MHTYAKVILVALLTLAQLALGASGGGVACFGGHTETTHASCSHGDDHGGLRLPRPTEPHGHEDDCPCVDVPSPLGRVEDRRAGVDVMRDAALLVLLPVPAILIEPRHETVVVVENFRPPDTPLVLRTTRLII
jgi:hypothetical protein